MSNKVGPAPSETAPLIGGSGLSAVSGESAVSVSVSARNNHTHCLVVNRLSKFVLQNRNRGRRACYLVVSAGWAVRVARTFPFHSADTNGLKNNAYGTRHIGRAMRLIDLHCTTRNTLLHCIPLLNNSRLIAAAAGTPRINHRNGVFNVSRV